MLITCPGCKARVDAREISEYSNSDEELDMEIRYSFLKCPSCNDPILAKQWRPSDDEPWDSPTRLYPPLRRLSLGVPVSLRRSFREAAGCQESGHYLATALMCRRIVEGICKDYLGDIPNLAAGLDALHEKNFIDDRLLEWATALREDGNLAAHDLSARIASQDAAALVDFAEAIIDYVYVLRGRFEDYKDRRAKRVQKGKTTKASTKKQLKHGVTLKRE